MNAYFTCIFGKNSMGYAKGASVMAYSLKLCQSAFPICCMITRDIPLEAYELLERVFDFIYIVDYINIEPKNSMSKKQTELYSQWINVACTKWNILQFDQYEKICFLDSDIIVVQNIDHVFEYAPSSVFANVWIEEQRVPEEYKMDFIPPPVIENMLNNKNICIANAHFMVLKPSMEEFKEFKEIITQEPFGFNSISMIDEQAIVYYQSIIKQRNWKVFRHDYNMVLWHTRIIKKIMSEPIRPFIIHYMVGSKKVWDMKRDEYPDIELWWSIADELISHDRNVSYVIQPGERKISECPYCLSMKYPDNHNFIENGKIVCPLMCSDTLSDY